MFYAGMATSCHQLLFGKSYVGSKIICEVILYGIGIGCLCWQFCWCLKIHISILAEQLTRGQRTIEWPQGIFMPPRLRTGHKCDSKVHGANMGPSGAPLLAPWTLLSGQTRRYIITPTFFTLTLDASRSLRENITYNPICIAFMTDTYIYMYIRTIFTKEWRLLSLQKMVSKVDIITMQNCRRHCFLKILSTCELIAGQLRPILGIPWTYLVLIALGGKWNINQKDGRRVYPWRYSDYIVCHM